MVTSIPHRGFDFVSVVKTFDGVTVPTLMFPDWKHRSNKEVAKSDSKRPSDACNWKGLHHD